MSTTLIFKELCVRNFMSFGNSLQTIDFNQNLCTLIMGDNRDANSNNGAGKTTIINAICYAFYNKPFDNINLPRLINRTNGAKNTMMEVSLTFQKGDDEYKIYRSRGEEFNILLSMNGEDITRASVTENDQAIEDIIGISYELFTKVVIFSGASIPFLQLPVSQQRQQIEELFNITLLSEKAVKLKEIIRTTEDGIAIAEAVSKEQEAQIATYERQLRDASARVSKWEDDRVRQVEVLSAELEKFQTVDIAIEKGLHAQLNDLAKETLKVEAAIRTNIKDRTQLAADISKLEKEIAHLKSDKCPYCKQNYAEAATKLHEKEQEYDTKAAKHAEAQAAVEKSMNELALIKGQATDCRDDVKYKNLEEAVQAESAALTAEQRINELAAAENPHVEAFEELKNHAVKKVSYEELDNLKKDLEHQQFLLKLLTDKNSFIRRAIISRTIPFLNSRLVHYTRELGLPHIVKFDPDMSCTVSEMGNELDYGNLSGGEKKRVNLSLSLAFRDVLHHLHAKVNCLFIDEIDASLDQPGVEDSFKLLKQKTRIEGLSTWIISHRPEAIGRFDRTLTIRKENGFSRILEDEEEAA